MTVKKEKRKKEPVLHVYYVNPKTHHLLCQEEKDIAEIVWRNLVKRMVIV